MALLSERRAPGLRSSVSGIATRSICTCSGAVNPGSRAAGLRRSEPSARSQPAGPAPARPAGRRACSASDAARGCCWTASAALQRKPDLRRALPEDWNDAEQKPGHNRDDHGESDDRGIDGDVAEPWQRLRRRSARAAGARRTRAQAPGSRPRAPGRGFQAATRARCGSGRRRARRESRARADALRRGPAADWSRSRTRSGAPVQSSPAGPTRRRRRSPTTDCYSGTSAGAIRAPRTTAGRVPEARAIRSARRGSCGATSALACASVTPGRSLRCPDR